MLPQQCAVVLGEVDQARNLMTLDAVWQILDHREYVGEGIRGRCSQLLQYGTVESESRQQISRVDGFVGCGHRW